MDDLTGDKLWEVEELWTGEFETSTIWNFEISKLEVWVAIWKTRRDEQCWSTKGDDCSDNDLVKVMEVEDTSH